MNIFHRASVRLATLYLIIIMFISMVFSLGLYRLSSHEIERSIRRQPSSLAQFFQVNNIDGYQDMLIGQDVAIDEALSRIKINLAIINLFIFISGGLLSYYLARRTLKPIEDAHEAQSRFTADASHELRTPITAMRIETELTLTEPKLTLKEAKAQLESNIEELDKLTALSEGLLQLSQLENARLDKSDCNLDNIIKKAIARVSVQAQSKNQTIVYKNKKVMINANSQTMIEALVTILDNAVKYSPEDTEIVINIEFKKQDVLISIKNDGDGILEIDINRIFERFYRADQSRNKNEISGYGIGLSIAKAAIEAHGGTISVTSKSGNGATFTVSLPL